MASVMDLAPKSAQNLRSKGGDCKKIYVPKLKEIDFWLFYKEFTGIKSTIVKKFMISLKIILRPWIQPIRIHLLDISRVVILR